MDLREFRVVVRIVDRVAKRALFAEEQMVALEGQCAEWKRIADELKAERSKLCETEVERDAWKRSYQDLSKSAHRELTEVRVTARKEIERTREEQRNVWHEQLGARDDESLSDAIKRVLDDREVVTKAERDAQSVLIEEQRRLLAEKQTEIGALGFERDDLRKIVEMVHADLGIQRGDHVGEAISELKKEASDATARQRMTEARALNYSLQAEEARRETERLRAKLASRTVEWPEWAKVGARVRVRSTRYAVTQCNFVGGEEFVVAKADEYEWALMSKHQFWAHVSDLEPVAEHTQPAVEYVDRVGVRQGDAPLVVSPQVGDTVRLIKRPSTAWNHTWGEAGEIAVVNYVLDSRLYVNRANGWKNDWPLSCVEVVKGADK